MAGQLGMEPRLRDFIANMVEVFDLCCELLADDGSLWMNMGDGYIASKADRIKPKELTGQPWRLAFALHGAMQEPVSSGAHARGSGVNPKAAPSGWDTSPGGHREKTGRHTGTGVGLRPRVRQDAEAAREAERFVLRVREGAGRHAQSPHGLDHSDAVIRRRSLRHLPRGAGRTYVLAGTRPGDIVSDPFMASATVASVAQRLGRWWLGAELSPEYIALQGARTRQLGLMLEAMS